jgi:hypothetical protein
MAPKVTSRTLRETIQWLEAEKVQQGTQLKEQFRNSYENLKPMNVLKETLRDVVKSPSAMEDIFVPLLGLGTGYLTKRIVVGKSEDPDRVVIAEVLGKSVTALIAQHPTEIAFAGRFLARFLFGKRRRKSSSDDD